MFDLLRVFSTMLKAGEKTAAISAAPSTRDRLVSSADSGEIIEITAKLNMARQLLVIPTAGSVCQVGLVLEDIQGRVAKLSRETAQHDPDQIRSLQGELGRVRSLIEGALRVQWTQMRAVMALTQSYLPGGRVSHWQPVVPKVDLKV
jgi:hypothetical protein